MPMLDAFIPEGALDPKAEAQLLSELTEILIRLEGIDPNNERARAVTWIFLHRPQVFVAGSPSASPRYRFITSVPEGQYNDEARKAVVQEVTEAVARAESSPFEEVSQRVWVFPTEVPDGLWGARGQVLRLPDILAYLVGEDERQLAEERLTERRREAAAAILDVVNKTVGGKSLNLVP
jgi:phenylpyruvate tautomerase PptA (4-oxalocrotonate tautomerase family)